MRTLTAADILQVWERGAQQPPLERALAMLAVACPELTPAQLAELDLGQRDAWLWRVRELTFGPRLAAFTQCPQCAERLEFALDVPSMLPAANQPQRHFELATADGTLQCRLPTSEDLRAIAQCRDLVHAQRALALRCVLEPHKELSEAALLAMAQHLQQQMPAAEISLAMECPACRHRWQPWLDVVSFLWNEIAAQARRSLREIHLLACAYGWQEADILALSAVRRQAYLGMLS
jgi:hypothetical protein